MGNQHSKKITIDLDYDTALFMLNIIRQALVSYSLLPKALKTSSLKQIDSLTLLVDNLQKQIED
jgi:hypothetical protein